MSGPRGASDVERVVPEREDADWSLGWLEMRKIAAESCTPRELEALGLRARGLDYAGIARTLGISRASARGRVKRGERKLARALVLR
jgi:DNA-binding NarL/FixJ family response regulator